MIKLALAIVGACLLLAGCGTTFGCACGAEPISPSPPSAAGPVAGFDVLITEKDQAVTVHAGQRIEVYLRQRAGLTAWSGLRSDDEAVLAPVPTGITAGRWGALCGAQTSHPR